MGQGVQGLCEGRGEGQEEGVGGQGGRMRRRVNWCLGLGHFFAVR